MADYYVDFAAGDDGAVGDQAHPWKTLPGTRTVDGTAFISAAWGAITTLNVIPKGTIILLKSGTTYDSSIGGYILISHDYYAADADSTDRIIIRRDITWGSGQVIFDGTGMAISGGLGLIHVENSSTVGGIELDGGTALGIRIQNSSGCGFATRQLQTKIGPWIYDVEFFNNGTGYTGGVESASDGSIRILRSIGGEIERCIIDGGGHGMQGMSFADDDDYVIGFTVTDCTVHNITGADPPNDAGIGFKAQNGQITFTNCTAYDCLKGMDLGEQDSLTTWDIVYKVVNCLAYENKYGINFSGSGVPRTGLLEWYVINTIIRDNTYNGSYCYSGPYKLYLINSIYDNNGEALNDRGNIRFAPGGHNDENHIEIYVYNTIFAKTAGGTYNLCVPYGGDGSAGYDTDLNMYMDYNFYEQRDTEYFCRWIYYAGTGKGTSINFAYGADGPGHGAGSNWFDNDDDAGVGIGHQGCDEHSKGDGCTDTTEPPFTDRPNHDYTLTAAYVGVNLTTKPWFISEMGLDRGGTVRTEWNMGAYERVVVPPNSVTIMVLK